jgi:hypothetical protein
VRTNSQIIDFLMHMFSSMFEECFDHSLHGHLLRSSSRDLRVCLEEFPNIARYAFK